MATTFEKFANYYANYSSKPTIDVEIVKNDPLCNKCHSPIERIPGRYEFEVKWGHVIPGDEHYVSPTTTCMFCGNNEPGTVHYRQMSYSDETECDRCGGRSGYGIGD